MSRYIAQSLLPYLLSTIRLMASRWDFLASQMATNCTSFSGSIQFKHAGAAAADADAAEHDAFAGRDGAVEAQRGGGDEAGRGDRAAGKHGALKKLPAGEGGHAGRAGGWAGSANLGKRFVLRHWRSLTASAPRTQKFSSVLPPTWASVPASPNFSGILRKSGLARTLAPPHGQCWARQRRFLSQKGRPRHYRMTI